MSIASVLTIYPTALKVEEVLTARARGGDVSLGHRLTTFPELVDALDRDVVSAAPVVNDALAIVLMQEALADALGATANERPALARALRRTLGELAAACIGADELAAIARATAAAEARRRLRWLARVAAAYRQRLARLGRADRHQRDRRVLALLHAHERAATRPRALAGVARLVIAEIYDYSPVQFLITRALIRLVGDAELVTLAHGENVDATRFVERTWNRFVEDPAIADKVLPDFVVRGGRAGTLSRILEALFSEPKPPPPADAADGSVCVVAAATRLAEVEDVGRRIQGALAGGVAAERIAILARDLAPYRALLEDVARRYRLPLALRAPRALPAHAAVQAVLRLVRAAADGLPRDAVSEALESAYVAAAPRGVRRVLAAAGYVDAATVSLARCLTHAEERLCRLAASDAPERVRARHAHDLARLRRDGPAVAAILRRLALLDQPRTFAAHAAALLRLVAELGVVVPSGAILAGEAASEGVALAALTQLLADLAELGAALAPRRMPLVEFLARLLEALEALEVEAPGPRSAGVRVLPIADARGLDFDDVFVLGLDDGSFPAPLAEDALLGDGLRREVNRHAPSLVRAALGAAGEGAPLGRVLRSSGERAAEDPFLFYLALSTAERRVVLTHPLRDDGGAALVRSPFVDEIVAIAGSDVLTAAAADGRAAPPPALAADGDELLHAAVLAAADGRPGLLSAVGARLPPETLTDLVTRIRVERRRARYFLLDRERDAVAKDSLADAFVGHLAADPVRREHLRAMEWSASRLDELGACGFKFFAHRMLHLDDDEPGSEALDAREEGSLVHRLLEVVLRRCDPLPVDAERAAAAARGVAEAEHATIAAEVRAADPQLFALSWARAVEAVVELVRLEAVAVVGGTTRRLLEWPFRFTIADHRLVAADQRLDLTVTGVVDRADLTLDGEGRIVAARVIDYKNSKRESEYTPRVDPTRAMGRTSFQIPLYGLALTAAPDLAWAPGAAISGGYILMRTHRKEIVRPLDPAWLVRDAEARRSAGDGAVAPIASRIVELVETAANGRFDVEPLECSRFCAYRHICRYEPPPEEGE